MTLLVKRAIQRHRISYWKVGSSRRTEIPARFTLLAHSARIHSGSPVRVTPVRTACPGQAAVLKWGNRQTDSMSMVLGPTVRRKLGIAVFAVAFVLFFMIFGAFAVGAPVAIAALTGLLSGIVFAYFELFYVQGRAGRWLRRKPPLVQVPIYAAFLCVGFVVMFHIAYYAIGPIAGLGAAYSRLAVTVPLVFVIGSLAIVSLRVIGYFGARNLFNLLTGRYLRPTLEQKVFLVLDLRDSTAVVDALGHRRAAAFVGKFLFDASRPITEHGGEIYVYTGDGLIAMWDWPAALAGGAALAAVDALQASIEREGPAYLHGFGRVPKFGVGIHGGEVVIAEQGDTKRAIGIFGDAINLAARMEEIAKQRRVGCVVSADLASQFKRKTTDFSDRREERVKGYPQPIAVVTYRSEAA